ncbi:hypothetical protein E2C01_061223 [Portunus trituberculatus]|uniref:Uncharacterized protein n=1 Tax=Portunus trituberculatus TaxID=210409 RepID=A0A5B7HB36_PORTR|nr:hypothetical protein [Portunus trituberculatus]
MVCGSGDFPGPLIWACEWCNDRAVLQVQHLHLQHLTSPSFGGKESGRNTKQNADGNFNASDVVLVEGGGESLAAVMVSPERAPEGSLIPGFLHLYPYTFYRVKAPAVFCSHRTQGGRGTPGV